jgi:hypothetical protein
LFGRYRTKFILRIIRSQNSRDQALEEYDVIKILIVAVADYKDRLETGKAYRRGRRIYVGEHKTRLLVCYTFIRGFMVYVKNYKNYKSYILEGILEFIPPYI